MRPNSNLFDQLHHLVPSVDTHTLDPHVSDENIYMQNVNKLITKTPYENAEMFAERQDRFIENYGFMYFKANDVLAHQLHRYEEIIHQTFTRLLKFKGGQTKYYGFFYNQNYHTSIEDVELLGGNGDNTATERFLKLIQDPDNTKPQS